MPTNDYKLHDIRPVNFTKVFTPQQQLAHDEEEDTLVVEHFSKKKK